MSASPPCSDSEPRLLLSCGSSILWASLFLALTGRQAENGESALCRSFRWKQHLALLPIFRWLELSQMATLNCSRGWEMWSSWILCGFWWLVSWLSHRVTLLISPFCRWENWGLEKGNHLTQFTELARDITRIISVWLCPIKLSVMEYSVSVMIKKVATAHLWPEQSPPTLSSLSLQEAFLYLLIPSCNAFLLLQKTSSQKKISPSSCVKCSLFMGDILCPIFNDSKWRGMGVLKIMSKVGTSMQG